MGGREREGGGGVGGRGRGIEREKREGWERERAQEAHLLQFILGHVVGLQRVCIIREKDNF